MSNALQAATAHRKHIILKDVSELVPQVPSLTFSGSIPEVVSSISEFEDGFVFVPVQKPKVAGDFYVANTYKAENPKILPEYSATSAYYHLLRSSDTLQTIGEALLSGDSPANLFASAIVQRQVSVRIYDQNAKDTTPVLYYINSYDRSTREQIVFGFAFVGMKYMHRRSGTNKEDIETLVEFLNDSEGYQEMVKRMREYDFDMSLFKSFVSATKIPLRKIAVEMLGAPLELVKEHEENSTELRYVNTLIRNRYGSGDNLSIENFVRFMHSVYAYNAQNGRFDHATRFVSSASTFMRKTVLPHFKLGNLI